MLIRLVPHGFSARGFWSVPNVVELGVGRRLRGCSDAQQALEHVEWEEPPVEAKRELVEVRLKVLRRDAMVNAIEPCLEVAEYKVNERQVLLRNVGIVALRDLRETAPRLREVGVAQPVVGRDVGARLHRVHYEALKRFRRAVRSDVQTQASSAETTATRECLARISCPPHSLCACVLDRSHNQCFVVLSAALAGRAASDPRLIDFYGQVTANAVAIRAHHWLHVACAGSERQSRSASGPELALELHSAMPGVWLDTRYAAQNQIEIGVRVRCITLLAVSDVSRLQWLHRSTTEVRFKRRDGSPSHLQYWQTKPLGHRINSKCAAQAASSANSRMKSGSDVGKRSLATTVPK